MHRLLAWLFPLLFASMLLADLAFWSGVQGGPVGAQVLRSAQKEAPLALAYTHAGEALSGALGLREWTAGFAERRAGQAYDEVEAVPEAAMDVIMRGMSWTMRAAHSGAPLVLLAWGLWYWRRPRQLRTLGRR